MGKIKSFLSRKHNLLVNYPNNRHLFDTKYALAMFVVGLEWKFFVRSFSDKWRTNLHEHNAIESYLARQGYLKLMRNFYPFDSDILLKNKLGKDAPIWVCWWQGKDSMPDVVRVCYERLQKMSGLHPVRLITFDNCSQYVDIPEALIDKAQKGTLKYSHLSDLLRLKLLARYGGLWVDSTIFISRPIDDWCFNSLFFTIKNYPFNNYSVTAYRWSGFLLGSSVSESPYFKALSLALESCLLKEKTVIHYLIIDYFIDMLYQDCTDFKRIIDDNPETNPDLHTLREHQNEVFSEDKWNEMMERTTFFKMSYREKAVETTDDGQMTMYGYLLKQEEKKQ